VAVDTLALHESDKRDYAAKWLTEQGKPRTTKQEIEMGFSALHKAAGVPLAPFFRLPYLQHPPQILAYFAERNIATFSTDLDSVNSGNERASRWSNR
jgi:hypothetical protein